MPILAWTLLLPRCYFTAAVDSYGEIPWRDATNIAGAGMAISSILDWSRYLRQMIQETGPISKTGHHKLPLFPSRYRWRTLSATIPTQATAQSRHRFSAAAGKTLLTLSPLRL